MKTQPVTEKRLKSKDNFRAQVQLENRMTWAAGYNAIYDHDKKLAAKLRDALSEQVEDKTMEHLQTLLTNESFRLFYKNWVASHITEEARAEYNQWVVDKRLTAVAPLL